MQRLPNRKEREWILSELATLVRTKGSDSFLSSPILEPTKKFFPDPWKSSPESLDRVTRRLLQYAGLGRLDVDFEFYEEDVSDAGGCGRSLAFFRGIDSGRCSFGLNLRQSPDAEHLAGVMAHEVAHAYRSFHRLRNPDDEEELRTDLTTVYLGFGVLTVNNTYRFRSSGEIRGNWAITRWATHSSGYLPPQAIAFSLAAQLVSRRADDRTRRRVHGLLEANQAACLAAALENLEESSFERSDLSSLVGSSPLALRGPEEFLRPIPLYSGPAEVPAEDPREAPEPWNEGKYVFRVVEAAFGAHVFFFALAGMIVAGVVSLATEISPAWVIVAGVVGALLGARKSRERRYERCSDSGCKSMLGAADSRCPNCGGTVAGVLRSVNDRLEAVERLERGETIDDLLVVSRPRR